MDPRPRLALAVAPDSATHPLADPTIKFESELESPAIAVKSASYAWTFEPMAMPRLLLLVAALATSDKLLAETRNPPPPENVKALIVVVPVIVKSP
jgi:hypothetical protein